MTISNKDSNEEKIEEETGELPFYKSPDNVSPPVKPFNRESKMPKKQSTKYQPNIPRKIVDIPNPSAVMMGGYRNVEENDDQKLVVGKTITINGDISSCNTLIVEGTVEANVFDVVSIDIAPGGVFKGNAKVANAYIAGNFDGTLETTKDLEISETGKVNGTIKYKNISIVNGGALTGNISIIKGIDVSEK